MNVLLGKQDRLGRKQSTGQTTAMAVLLECAACYQSYAVPPQALRGRTVCPWCGEPSSFPPLDLPAESSSVGSSHRFGSAGVFPELSPSRFPKRRQATPAVLWMIVGIGLGAGVVLAVLTFASPERLGRSADDERLERRPNAISTQTPTTPAAQAESLRQRELVRQVLREELGGVRASPDVADASDRRSGSATALTSSELRASDRAPAEGFPQPAARTTDRWKSSRPPPVGHSDDDSPPLGLMLPERDHSRPNRASERTQSEPAARESAPPVRARDDATAIAALVAAGIRCDKDSATGLVTRVDGSFRMTDALMVHIAKLLGLKQLKLSFAEVTDSGLAYVKDLMQLEELILNQTRISDAGLAHLEKLARLEKLDVEKTQVSDDGLSRLKMLKELKLLDIRGTKITPAAATSLKESMPSAKIRH